MKIYLSILLSQFIFNLSLLTGYESNNHKDWQPKLYGHFLPFMKEGPTSLSMYFDVENFIIEQTICIIITIIILQKINIKFNLIAKIIIPIFFIISTIFVYMILLPDGKVNNIAEKFDYTTLNSYWIIA